MTNEFSLIARYFTRPGDAYDADVGSRVELGPGDDCALLRLGADSLCAITTDMLAAGTHFFADTDPHDLGWKSLAVNLSDLAAMGATPRYAQLALCLPPELVADATWVEAFAKGFFLCADRFGVTLSGGDMSSGALNICITAIGEIPAGKALRRAAAQAGDDLWVSGTPGLAALGLGHLQKQLVLPERIRDICLAALHRPQPRVQLGLALANGGLANAAIDISDGLLADLGHILKASQLAAEVHLPTLPLLSPQLALRTALLDSVGAEALRSAQLAGGDDYELCFTARPAQRLQIAAVAAEMELPLWRIGTCLAGEPGLIRVLDADAQEVQVTRRGYEHFV